MNATQLNAVAATVGIGTVLAAAVMTVAVDTAGNAGPDIGPNPTGLAHATTETTVRGPQTSVAVPPITTPPFTIPTGEPQ